LLVLSVDVAVIVAVPAATAVIVQPSTVATSQSLVDQVTVFTNALLGVITASTVSVSQAVIVNVVTASQLFFIVTPVTATFSTVIVAVSYTAQLETLSSIHSHNATGVTTHSLVTLILLLVVDQLIGNSLQEGVTV
jgi:hypothetical protein